MLTVDTSVAAEVRAPLTSGSSSSSTTSSPGRRARRRAAAVRAGRPRALRKGEQRRLREFGVAAPASAESALELLRAGKIANTAYHLRHAPPVRDDAVLSELGALIASSSTSFAIFLLAHMPDMQRAAREKSSTKESETFVDDPTMSLMDCGRLLHNFSGRSVAELYVRCRDSNYYVYEAMLMLFEEYRRQLVLATCSVRLAAARLTSAEGSEDKVAVSRYMSARREQTRLLVSHPLSEWSIEIGRASANYGNLTADEWLAFMPCDPFRVPELLHGLWNSTCSPEEMAYVLTSFVESWLVYGYDCCVLLRASSAFAPFSPLVAALVRGDLLETGGRREVSVWRAVVSSSSVADEEMGLSASEDVACRSLLAHLMLSAPEVWRAALDLDSSLASGDKLAPLLSVASDIEIVTRALFPTA